MLAIPFFTRRDGKISFGAYEEKRGWCYMKTYERKLVTIVTEAALETQLIAEIKNFGAHGYTIVEARGEGARGVRTSEWEEDKNIRIEVVCDESVADAMIAYFAKNYYANYAMIIFVSNVEVVRPEKF